MKIQECIQKLIHRKEKQEQHHLPEDYVNETVEIINTIIRLNNKCEDFNEEIKSWQIFKKDFCNYLVTKYNDLFFNVRPIYRQLFLTRIRINEEILADEQHRIEKYETTGQLLKPIDEQYIWYYIQELETAIQQIENDLELKHTLLDKGLSKEEVEEGCNCYGWELLDEVYIDIIRKVNVSYYKQYMWENKTSKGCPIIIEKDRLFELN